MQAQQSSGVSEANTKTEVLQRENLELKSQVESLIQINKNLSTQYNNNFANRNIIDYSLVIVFLFLVVGFLLRKQFINVYKKIRSMKNEVERN